METTVSVANLLIVNTAATEAGIENKNLNDEGVEVVEMEDCPLSDFVAQIVGYLTNILLKNIESCKSRGMYQLFVKIGSQIAEHTDQIWCTVKVGSKHISYLQIQVEEFLAACSAPLSQTLKDMQDHFGGEHLWCEYPCSAGSGEGTCQRAQWKIGPFGTRPQCCYVQKKKQINACALCFRLLQDNLHVVEECRLLENFMHKLAVVHPDVKLKLSIEVGNETRCLDFGPHAPKTCTGQKKIMSSISHFARIGASPSFSKIMPRCGVGYTMQQVNVNDHLERVQLKVSTIAALLPPRPINTALLNHTVKRLQVLLYGPVDIPLCTTNHAQVGLCPTTLIGLEDYGLKIGDRIRSQYNSGQEHLLCDWSYRLELLEIADAGEELDITSEDSPDDTTLLLWIFVNTADKIKFSALDNIYIADYVRKNFAQIICKNRAKVRKAVGTAVNKILHNFSAHDQKQSVVDTSIPTITSALGNIVMHSTNSEFRSNVFKLMAVSETKDYKKALRSTLWKIANERYAVIRPKLTGAHGKSSGVVTATSTGIPDAAPDLIQQSVVPPVSNQDSSAKQSCTAPTVHSAATTSSLPPGRDLQGCDFDDLETMANSNLCGEFCDGESEKNNSLSSNQRQDRTDISSRIPAHRTDLQCSSSHTVRRSLSREFASHTVTPSLGTNMTGVECNTPALILDNFDILGRDQSPIHGNGSLKYEEGRTANLSSTELLSSVHFSVTEPELSPSELKQPTEVDWWDNVTWT